jgi:hypothetical protein
VWSLPRFANRYRTPASRIASSIARLVVEEVSATAITTIARPDPVADRQQRAEPRPPMITASNTKINVSAPNVGYTPVVTAFRVPA